jgi:hypothetical protein
VKQPKQLLRGHVHRLAAEHGKAWMYEKRVCWPACFACWDAARRQRKLNVYRRDTGQQARRVDPTETRRLIRNMVNVHGYSLRTIATECGVDENTVRRFYRVDWEIKYTLSSFADAVQALYESERPKYDNRYSNFKDATLARNAIRGLMRQGWSQVDIAERTGIDRYAISKMVAPKHTRYIKPENERRILEVTREIGSAEGGNTRTKAYAVRQGWPPTIAHDGLV